MDPETKSHIISMRRAGYTIKDISQRVGTPSKAVQTICLEVGVKSKSPIQRQADWCQYWNIPR